MPKSGTGDDDDGDDYENDYGYYEETDDDGGDYDHGDDKYDIIIFCIRQTKKPAAFTSALI